jgi:hypothetical protein
VERTWLVHLIHFKHGQFRLISLNCLVDHTLALLYTSCHSRGLPHQLVRNLAFLRGSEKERIWQIQGKRKAWDPHNTSPALKPKNLNALAKKQNEAQFESNADEALSEVIRMAEGCGNLTLGRESTISSRTV